LHEASHWVVSPAVWQWPLQCPSQSPEHVPSQLKLPEQPPVQLASQVVTSHDTLALALQFPLQLASSCAWHWTSTLTGVHWAVQPPEVSIVHVSVPLKSMFPHD
jgi:hypothetical protein